MKEFKKETIEQAIDRIYPLHKGQTCIAKNKKFLKRTAFEKGAKWQQEQSNCELSELMEHRNEMLAMLEELYEDVECWSDISSYGYGNKIEQLIKEVKDNG